MDMGSIRSRGKKNKIEINFFYRGVRHFEQSKYYCETGKQDCKCRSCRSAAALVAEIERKINDGIFRYADYFPKSKAIKTLPIADTSAEVGFTVYAYQWLSLKETTVEYSSFRTYTRYVNRLVAYFKNVPIKDIKPSTVQTYIRDSKVSPKTISNIVGMLSSIFKAALHDDIIDKNPCDSVSKPRIHTEEVDPFELDEIQAILTWMQKHYPAMTAFFAIAFYTGMRTGEIMALKWQDFDFNKYVIHVRRTITEAKIKESTKTSDSRIIDIDSVLDQYITAHKQYTFMKSDWLFITYQNQPFKQIQNIVKTYYDPCLKALGIKYRNIYQTRHTFACLFIDKGAELNWIKKMLGNRTLEMILKRYGNRVDRIKKERISFIDNSVKNNSSVANMKANH